MKTTFRIKKIAYNNKHELISKINALQAKEILKIRPCIPDRTDTMMWIEVFYEYYVNKP
jgi:hypothetical protein